MIFTFVVTDIDFVSAASYRLPSKYQCSISNQTLITEVSWFFFYLCHLLSTDFNRGEIVLHTQLSRISIILLLLWALEEHIEHCHVTEHRRGWGGRAAVVSRWPITYRMPPSGAMLKARLSCSDCFAVLLPSKENNWKRHFHKFVSETLSSNRNDAQLVIYY